MGYNFTKGHYQAFIRTTYKDWTGASQTVDGPPAGFDCNMKTVLRFKTNPNIIVDEDELVATNAELVSEGNYKGLDYKIYDNDLAIVTGTQTETMATGDTSPWQTGCDYIYVNCIVNSGFVFRNDDCLELQVGYLGFVDNPYPSSLFRGTSYLYLNVSKIDLTTNARTGALFHGVVTEDIDGLEELVNNLPSNVTSASSLLSTLEITGTKTLSFNVDISNFSDTGSAYAMFGLTGEHCDVTVHSNLPRYAMFGGNADVGESSYLKSLTVIIDSCPNDSDRYTYFFNGCFAKKITIQKMEMPDPTTVSSSFTMLGFFKGCTHLEELVINSNSGFTFDYGNVADLFRDDVSLKRIRDENYHDYIISTSNWFYAF